MNEQEEQRLAYNQIRGWAFGVLPEVSGGLEPALGSTVHCRRSLWRGRDGERFAGMDLDVQPQMEG